MKQAAYLLFLLFLSIGCKETIFTPNTDFGYTYQPLQVGQISEYRIDSIVYDPIPGGILADTTRWHWIETIESRQIAENGDTLYRGIRQIRPWGSTTVVGIFPFTISRSSSRYIVQEDNLPVLKMVYPVQQGLNWNPLLFISPNTKIEIRGEPMEIFKSWDGRIESVDQPFTVGATTWQEALVVELAASENLIEQRQVQEVYAKGIGLVYRYQEILDTQCKFCCRNDLAACSQRNWAQKAEAGFRLVQQRIK